jgi:hypothetical protein
MRERRERRKREERGERGKISVPIGRSEDDVFLRVIDKLLVTVRTFCHTPGILLARSSVDLRKGERILPTLTDK